MKLAAHAALRGLDFTVAGVACRLPYAMFPRLCR